MIQRIQSVYLAIATFLMVLLFSNPLAEIIISDSLYLTQWHHKITATNHEMFATISTWPVTALLSVIMLIELITIFLYKNRQLQIRLCIYNLLLMVGLVGLIYFFTKSTLISMDGKKSVLLWPVLCPLIAIILNFLAFKAIQKDEKLVKSYDRIR
jgi:hypothetical protein